MADKKQNKASSKPEKENAKPAKKADKKPAEQSGAKKVFARIKQFFKDVKGESKKIVWNSWNDTVKNTGVVLMVTLIVGAGVWISDVVFRQLMELVYSLAGNGGEEAIIMLSNLL
ncbi:MAG: preprotein translocase subunit SecE [Oscillospiraceae bacterium]|nr:preprotein translocase subunit SecE [Oscillospiraceae bacterium]